jgi:hypothetical protein
VRIARLVGVDEHRVERAVGLERRQHVDARALEHRHLGAEPRRGEVGPGQRGVARLVLDRPQVAVGRQRPRDVQRRVADQRADLDGAVDPGQPAQQRQQLALRRTDHDRRHVGRRREGPRQRVVVGRVDVDAPVEDRTGGVALAGARIGIGHDAIVHRGAGAW